MNEKKSRVWHLTRIVWRGMIARCYKKSNPSYDNYGGRGIQVCDRWLGDDGFKYFLVDMGYKLAPRYRLDRIDNNKDYCPTNCRWVTAKASAENRTSTRWLYAFGEWKTMLAWSKDDRCKVSYGQLRNLLDKGFDAEEIIKGTKAYARRRKSSKGSIDWDNIDLNDLTHKDLAKHPKCTVSADTIKSRLAAEWSIKDAVFQPSGTIINPNGKRYDGKTLSEWARDDRCKVGLTELHRRINRGMPIEDAISERKRRPKGMNTPSN